MSRSSLITYTFFLLCHKHIGKYERRCKQGGPIAEELPNITHIFLRARNDDHTKSKGTKGWPHRVTTGAKDTNMETNIDGLSLGKKMSFFCLLRSRQHSHKMCQPSCQCLVLPKILKAPGNSGTLTARLQCLNGRCLIFVKPWWFYFSSAGVWRIQAKSLSTYFWTCVITRAESRLSYITHSTVLWSCFVSFSIIYTQPDSSPPDSRGHPSIRPSIHRFPTT